MKARYILTAALGAFVISTAAYANAPLTRLHRDHDTSRHTARDDLVNECVALPLQYSNAAAKHTAQTDKLRDQGVAMCRAGARFQGVEKLDEALKDVGVNSHNLY